jgi:aminodeoxyfutalosine synthase
MMQPTTTHPELRQVADKIRAGERLSLEDGVRLFASPDIHALGELANLVRERLHGRAAYYNVNRHVNYTNYCVLRCKFCSFYVPYGKERTDARDHADAGGVANGTTTPADAGVEAAALPLLAGGEKAAYELSVEEVVHQAREARDGGATEVHIVGGLHPRLPFSYYLDMCRGIREACPEMHIKAFTAIEIIHFTRISRPRRTIAEVLSELRDAGLGSLPGGGAEIFDDRVHDEAFKNKVGEAEWFEVHRTAHELGIFTNATMLYGHVERREERVAHLIKLREHQDESIASRKARFNCVIPLSFIPEGSALDELPGPTGLEDLKTLAVSRLMLDNIAHVKSFWIMHGPKLAQVSLNWGVDDIDGTVIYYDITKRQGGGTTHQELSVDQLRRLIVEAGREPIERDTLYRRVIRDGAGWHTIEPHWTRER